MSCQNVKWKWTSVLCFGKLWPKKQDSSDRSECSKDFTFLQINGRDISQATHEEVVEAFRSASEPILVEILPRKGTSPPTSASIPAPKGWGSNGISINHMLQPKLPPTDGNNENGEVMESTDQGMERNQQKQISSTSSSTSWIPPSSATPGNEISGSLCEISTQTEWSGGWENMLPFGPFGLWPYPSVPPPPPPSAASSGIGSGSGTTTGSNINPVEMASLLTATANGMNQFLGSHPFLGGMARDRQEQGQGEGDTDSEEEEDDEDEDECDAVEYEEIILKKRCPSESLGLVLSSLPPPPLAAAPLPHPPHPPPPSVPQSCSTLAPGDGDGDASSCHPNHPPGRPASPASSSSTSWQPLGEQDNGISGNESASSGEVYVNRLETDSLASKDARIKVGDQILEINGVEIKSREQTVALFSDSQVLQFLVLVGRTNPNHDHRQCRQRMSQRNRELFNWCSSSRGNHVSLLDTASDYCQLLLVPQEEEEDEEQEVVVEPRLTSDPLQNNGASADRETEDADLGAKDEKDSGVGKTDGESTCTRTNDTSSTDYELTLEKMSARSANTAANANTITSNNNQTCLQQTQSQQNGLNRYQSDTSLDREMSILHQEMANIQLECERLINRHLQHNSPQHSDGAKSGGLSASSRPETPDCASNGHKINERHFKDREAYLRQTSDPMPLSSGRKKPSASAFASPCSPPPPTTTSAPTPPPTPKHYPKAKQQVDKNDRHKSSSVKRTSSKTSDLLPELQPMEKKESIKRWIKSGIPTTPPPNRRMPPKLGICRPHIIDDECRELIGNSPLNKGHQMESSTGFTLQLNCPFSAPATDREGNNILGQYRGGGSLMSLVSSKKDSLSFDDMVLMEDKGTQMQESDVASLLSCESCKRCCRALLESRGKNATGLSPNYRCSSPSCVSRSSGGAGGSRGLPRHPKGDEYASLRNKSASAGNCYQESHSNYVTFHQQQQQQQPPSTATMYTNSANLHHTMLLQQELLRQALLQQQKSKKQTHSGNKVAPPVKMSSSTSHQQMSSYPDIISSSHRDPNGGHGGQVVPPSPSKSAPIDQNRSMSANNSLRRGLAVINGGINGQMPGNFVVNMEWKVKKRPDGSRYITKRPVRNKMLKERAIRITQERSGLTTDDDAMSELKVGKYWTRDEKKKQLEKARDRKRREMVMRSLKMGALREQSEEREMGHEQAQASSGGSGGSGSMARHRTHHLGKSNTLGSSGSSRTNCGVGNGTNNGNGAIIGHNHSHPKAHPHHNTVPSKNRLNELLTVTTV